MIRRTFAISDHWLPRFVRKCKLGVLNFGLPPIPRVLSMPLVAAFLAVRSTYYFVVRVFLCEPFFKAHCTKYGENVHTGVFLHWIQGRGILIIGDNVLIDGKCSFSFAARFSNQPTLIIGDNSGIGHGCSFTIGKKIVIGRHCRIAGQVRIFDSPGHPADPADRMAGYPPSEDEVRPVIIEDNVWIGQRAIILPGVTIGQGSIVAAGAVVVMDVPPNVLVAGNPARQFRKLTAPLR
jgi:carbonic anhydrase/acetyltransferase-like protein (isoleucine patch superfamily)